MLGNSAAPAILESLRRLVESGIRVHAQAVLMPGINDGDVLERTLEDLLALGEMVLSIALVPVGLTAHRRGLPRLREMSSSCAAEVLDAVERWQERFVSTGRGRTVYAADEFYLRAGRSLPPLGDYDDLPQLENGVGLLRSFEAELRERSALIGPGLTRPLSVTLITGTLAAEFIGRTVEETLGRIDGLTIRVQACENSLLGPTVTVAGLLSGADMADAIRAAGPSDAYLLPSAAFNDGGLTLDGMTLCDIARASGRDRVTATDDLVGAVLELAGSRRREERT
jgi:NifB/MoaA-like Fe-S oxidoreductase